MPKPKHLARVARQLREALKARARVGTAMIAVPDRKFLRAELRQLEAEFGAIRVAWPTQILSAKTAAIKLQDVYLGPFDIRLAWNRLPRQEGVRCFNIVALEPNPAASDLRVTHPHVKDERLCAGLYQLPLIRALDHGRLDEAFLLIRSALTHCSPGSSYVRLDRWRAITCPACGHSVDDDRCLCDGCAEEYCCACMAHCSVCGAFRCARCLTCCPSCRQKYCPGCVKACLHSQRPP
jgi:hypothetical protein